MSRRINHPGIIRLLEIYESEQYVHVVYDQLKGKELMAKIQSTKTYAEEDVSIIAHAVLSILSYIHESNIILRNLSPDSLFLR